MVIDELRRDLSGDVGRMLAVSARDIILLLELDGTLLFANHAAEHAYGRSASELVGMDIRELRAPDTRATVDEHIERAVNDGLLIETTHLRADGRPFPVEVSARAVDIDGSVRLLSVIRDISARRERERATQELVADVEAANGQLEGLLRIVSSAIGRVEFGGLFDEVLTALRDVMAADAALLFVLDEDVWRLRAQVGFEAHRVAGYTMGVDEGFASDVARAGEVLWIQDIGSSQSSVASHRAHRIGSMLGIPLVLNGALYGVLECAWSGERLVSDAERVMLQVAADRIVTAVAGAQRFESTLRGQRLQVALAEAASVLSSSHDLQATMPRVLGVGLAALGCDVAGFGPFRDGAIHLEYGVGVDEQRIPIVAHPEMREPSTMIVLVRSPDSTPTALSLLDPLGIDECIVVPVRVQGAWHGLLFGRKGTPLGCGDAERDFTRNFADTLSAGISNAIDYEAEHRIAEALQEALLTIDEDIVGIRFGHLYRSATHATRVGGDFYDIFAMSDGRVGVFVGDVSGKGLDAAVLTSLVKNTLRAFMHSDPSPAGVVGKANEVLFAAARLPDFASAVLLAVDPESGEVECCSAGHPPAIVRRADGTIERMAVGSPVMGALPDLSYEQERFVLAQGDVVVLYTDGVTEARSADGGFFAEERLVETLRSSADADVEAIPGAVNDAVMRFTGGRLSDDMAIVAFRLE